MLALDRVKWRLSMHPISSWSLWIPQLHKHSSGVLGSIDVARSRNLTIVQERGDRSALIDLIYCECISVLFQAKPQVLIVSADIRHRAHLRTI